MHHEFSFHCTRFWEQVGGIRKVGDVMEASNRVEGGLWDVCAEMILFFGVGGQCEEELGEDLVESLSRAHVRWRKRKPTQAKLN